MVEVVGIDDAVEVSVADGHACAVRKSGRVACWGSAHGGLLGTGEDIGDAVKPPVRVEGLSSL